MGSCKWLCALCAIALLNVAPKCDAQQNKKPFTVADDIGVAHFGDNWNGKSKDEVQASPDGNYFAVDSMRGELKLNRVENSLRFYRSEDIQDFLNHSDKAQPPSPVWIVSRSGREGPVIGEGWRWLPDSSGVAFLEGEGLRGDKRLMLADLRTRTVEPLTSAT